MNLYIIPWFIPMKYYRGKAIYVQFEPWCKVNCKIVVTPIYKQCPNQQCQPLLSHMAYVSLIRMLRIIHQVKNYHGFKMGNKYTYKLCKQIRSIPKDVTVLAERPTCHCCIHRTTQILLSLKTLHCSHRSSHPCTASGF